MLTLLPAEKVWMENYRKALDKQYPGLVRDMIVFGSKARGDARADSDLDLLLIIKEGDWRFKLAVSDLGYDLSLGTDCVPSIMVLTEEEREQRIQNESIFWGVIQEEGISVR